MDIHKCTKKIYTYAIKIFSLFCQNIASINVLNKWLNMSLVYLLGEVDSFYYDSSCQTDVWKHVLHSLL